MTWPLAADVEKLPAVTAGEDVAGAVTVEVPDAARCPRYTARVIRGCKVGPSPDWMVERLAAIGQRSVNNIVDVTNYILFLLGQPLHAFDLAKLKNADGLAHIVIRAAEDGEVVSANSLWTRESLQLLPEFQKAVEQNYGAEVHAGDLSVAAINEWVDSNTKGRIKKLLEQDDPSIVTYLINAMTFDAEWASPYEPQSCSEGTFHASDGAEQTVTYLSGEERGYLEVAGATGFVKHYSGGRYSFAGLLPAEGSTPEELLETLDGATLLNALCEPQAKKVYTRMPKFTASTTASLRPVLEAMGMQTAFTDTADFSLLSDTPLKIDAVQQKTYLQVDESGTIGAAVTSIPMMEATAVQTEEPKTVYLTRPYLCVIFDHETQSIVFLGIVNRVDG